MIPSAVFSPKRTSSSDSFMVSLAFCAKQVNYKFIVKKGKDDVNISPHDLRNKKEKSAR
jgi:hypothetical protein